MLSKKVKQDKSKVKSLDEGTLVSSAISQNQYFKIYNQTIKLIRPNTGNNNTIPPLRTGTQIQGFSKKSKGRLRFTAVNSSHKIQTQFCLTYHDKWPVNGREFKRQLNLFLTRIRQTSSCISYLWVAEFQTRGAPHVHFFSELPLSEGVRTYLAQTWCSIVDSEDKKLYKFHVNEKNYIAWNMGNGSYLCKYLDKEHQKQIPAGFYNFGRFWGNSRGLVDDPEIWNAEDIEKAFLNNVTGKKLGIVNKLIRIVGHHHEKKNKRSWFRKTNRSTSSLTGSSVFIKALEYFERQFDKLNRIKNNKLQEYKNFKEVFNFFEVVQV